MLGVGLFVALILGLAVIAGTVGSPVDGSIEFEFRKYIIQFLLIVALGAVVAFVAESLKQRREGADRERQYAVDTLTSLLNRLDLIYRSVKGTRRRFRVIGMKDLDKTAYVGAMSKLSDDKQEVEQLWRDIEVLEGWLPDLGPVRPLVKRMENYLGPLEDEWEAVGLIPDDKFRAESQKALEGFYVKWDTKKSTFRQFREPYYSARRALMTLLASKRTAA